MPYPHSNIARAPFSSPPLHQGIRGGGWGGGGRMEVYLCLGGGGGGAGVREASWHQGRLEIDLPAGTQRSLQP